MNSEQKIPTQKDWDEIIKGNENDPPLIYSYKVLFGKTIEDIKKSSISADALMDDIYWLDGYPFYYYMKIAMKLIQEKFYQGWDAESAAKYFFATIRNKHEHGMNFPKPFFDEIKVTAEFIFKNKQYFGVNKTNIYRYSDNPSVIYDMAYIKRMYRV